MIVRVVEVKPFTFEFFGENGSGVKGVLVVLQQRVTKDDSVVLVDNPNLRMAIYDESGESIAGTYAALGSELELTMTLAPPA